MTSPQKKKILAMLAAVAAGMIAMAAGPAVRDARAAEDPAKSRYTMTPAEGGGVLRLDTETVPCRSAPQGG